MSIGHSGIKTPEENGSTLSCLKARFTNLASFSAFFSRREVQGVGTVADTIVEAVLSTFLESTAVT